VIIYLFSCIPGFSIHNSFTQQDATLKFAKMFGRYCLMVLLSITGATKLILISCPYHSKQTHATLSRPIDDSDKLCDKQLVYFTTVVQ